MAILMANRLAAYGFPGPVGAISYNPNAGLAAGNTAILVIHTTALNVTAVSDSKGNTWTVDSSHVHSGSTAVHACAHSKLTSSLTTSDTITITFANTGNYVRVAWLYETDALVASAAFDLAFHKDAGAQFDSPQFIGPTGTLAQAKELIIAQFSNGQGSSIGATAGEGTAFPDLSSSSNANFTGHWFEVNATTGVSATQFVSRGDETYDASIYTFKEAAVTTNIPKTFGALTG